MYPLVELRQRAINWVSDGLKSHIPQVEKG